MEHSNAASAAAPAVATAVRSKVRYSILAMLFIVTAINVGDRQTVDALADKARAEGILKSGPRMTGDGYYEAVIVDPDGNGVELVG